MDLISFGTGALITAFAFALFKSDEEEPEADINPTIDSPAIKISDGKKRVVMSCQTCRKLKTHIEIEPYLFECVKCKRRVDLR